MASVFLETSIQIQRLMAGYARQIAIERQLAAPDIQAITSYYVLMEFQRSVLSDYTRVYNAILQHENWDATARALRSGKLSFKPRSLGRCLQILTRIMVLSQLERNLALELLQSQIKRSLPKRFWRNVTPLHNRIVCDLVRIGVNRQPDGSYSVANSCRKDMASCYLPDFLASHQAKLQAIHDYLIVHPHVMKNQARVERLLAAVLNNPRAALGQSSCWPLGDVIIVLQVPSDAILWTLDSDFEPLCTVLGLNLYKPSL